MSIATDPHSSFNISEFTQLDGRKKRTAKRLSVTNVTGLLLARFVGNSLIIDVSCSSTKRSVQRNVKFGGSKAKAKLLSRLSHKVCVNVYVMTPTSYLFLYALQSNYNNACIILLTRAYPIDEIDGR